MAPQDLNTLHCHGSCGECREKAFPARPLLLLTLTLPLPHFHSMESLPLTEILLCLNGQVQVFSAMSVPCTLVHLFCSSSEFLPHFQVALHRETCDDGLS